MPPTVIALGFVSLCMVIPIESSLAPSTVTRNAGRRLWMISDEVSHGFSEGRLTVDAPLQARENVGVVAARGRMLSSVRPWMRHDDSRRPVWEFADRVQITHSVLEAQWKALVVPAPSHRLLRHTLLPLTLTSSRSWSAYAAAVGVL